MVSNSPEVGIRNLYALLVGIDNYPQPINPLKGCVNDITAIETYLKNQIAGEWKLREPRILTNEQATRQAIIDGFQNYLCQAGSDDIALFYYSGHGEPNFLISRSSLSLQEVLLKFLPKFLEIIWSIGLRVEELQKVS